MIQNIVLLVSVSVSELAAWFRDNRLVGVGDESDEKVTETPSCCQFICIVLHLALISCIKQINIRKAFFKQTEIICVAFSWGTPN